MRIINADDARVENVMSMWRSGALEFERTPGNKNITGLLCRRIDTCEKYIARQDRAVSELEAELDLALHSIRKRDRELRGSLLSVLKLWWRSRDA